MDSLATPQDLINWWRPFEEDAERRTARTKLATIHRRIRSRFRELDPPRDLDAELTAAKTGTAAEKDWYADVRDIECEAVKRALVNPDGMASESIDDWSGRHGDKYDGSLFLTTDEWATIGVLPPDDANVGKAFTIDQSPAYVYVYDTPGGGYVLP